MFGCPGRMHGHKRLASYIMDIEGLLRKPPMTERMRKHELSNAAAETARQREGEYVGTAMGVASMLFFLP